MGGSSPAISASTFPGAPSVVPRKRARAPGSFLAVNRIFSTLPKDGTIIGLGGADLGALTKGSALKASASRPPELNWLGRVDSLINIVMMWRSSPWKTIADAPEN